MADNGVWRFTLQGMGPSSEEIISVLHYMEDSASPTPPLGVQSIVDGLAAALVTDYLLMIPAQYTYVKASVTGVSGPIIDLQAESHAHGGSVGLFFDDALTIERCGVLQKHTAVATRSGRGRMFVPMAPSSGFNMDGSWSQPYATNPYKMALDSFGALMIEERDLLVGVTLRPCLFNFASGLHPLLTGYGIGQLVGMQRRRRFGVGS